MARLVCFSVLVAIGIRSQLVVAVGNENVVSIFEKTFENRSIPEINDARCSERFQGSVREILASLPPPNLTDLSKSMETLAYDLAICNYMTRTKESLENFIFGKEYRDFHEYKFRTKYPTGTKRISSTITMKDILTAKVLQALEDSGLDYYDPEEDSGESYEDLITDFREDLWKSFLPDTKFDLDQYRGNFEAILESVRSQIVRRSKLRPPAITMDAIEEVLGSIVANQTSDLNVSWAENISNQWNKSRIKDLEARLRKIFPRTLTLPNCDFEKKVITPCLRDFIAGIIVLESTVRKDGVSMRFAPAFVGTDLRSFLGSVVPRILEKAESQLFSIPTENPNSSAQPNFQDMVFAFRSSMVECLDLGRKLIDENEASNVSDNSVVSRCLDRARSTGSTLANVLVSESEPTDIGPDRLIEAKNKMIDTFFAVQMNFYKKMRLLDRVARDFIEQGVLTRPADPESRWAWNIVSKWENSPIEDTDLRLKELFGDGHFANVRCTLESFDEITADAFTSNLCWRPLLEDLLVIESAVRKDGKSLETIFYGHPVLMSYIYIVDEVLSGGFVRSSTASRSTSGRSDSHTSYYPETTKEDLRRIASKYDEFLRTETRVLTRTDHGRTTSIVDSDSYSSSPPEVKTKKHDKLKIAGRRVSIYEIPPSGSSSSDFSTSFGFGYGQTPDSYGFGSPASETAPSTGSSVMDLVKSTMVQSMIGAVTGVVSDGNTESKTLLGGLAGRVADAVTYPIVGETGSKVVRGTVQGATDTLAQGVLNMLG